MKNILSILAFAGIGAFLLYLLFNFVGIIIEYPVWSIIIVGAIAVIGSSLMSNRH